MRIRVSSAGGGCAIVPLLALIGAVSIARGADVDCGATIASDTVVTGGSITAGSCADNGGAPILTVTAGASLDLNGHAVICASAADPGIRLTDERASVENGTVDGCLSGVQVRGTGRHRLTDVLVIRNQQGIDEAAGSEQNFYMRVVARASTNDGFRLSGGRATLIDAYASGNGQDGFELVSDKNRCVRCYAFGSDSQGFRLTGSRNTVVKSSSISNASNGFRLEGDRPVLKGNIAVRNGGNGIGIYDVETPVVVKNQLYGNGSSGIGTDDGDGGRFVANIAADNGYAGIEAVGATARGNVFVANQAISNENPGVRCGGIGTEYVFAANRAIANGSNGISVAGCSGRILRSTAFGNAQRNASLFDDLSTESAGCTSMSFSRNFLGTDEVPTSGVTVDDPCID